jgi:hypothetical protein
MEIMKKMANKTMVFYRCVKAQKGHPCAGLYGVEKVYIKDNTIYKKELVHEWDLRIISEAILAKLGGTAAYDAYAEDHELQDAVDTPSVEAAKARTAEDLKDMTKRKLNAELKGK